MSVSIADAIDLAINKYLWDGVVIFDLHAQTQFSCTAIQMACYQSHIQPSETLAYLQTLGCNCDEPNLFAEFRRGEKRQFARALWLTWASLRAREESKDDD